MRLYKFALGLPLIGIKGVQGIVDSSWVDSDYISSPAVYPSPNATGLNWDAAFAHATKFVAKLTLDEKIGLVSGTQGLCEGNVAPIPRLSFDGLCIQDGPLGVRFSDYVSVFPAGINVGAAWDRKLTYTRGQQIGAEFKAKGVHVAMAPVAGPLGRSPWGGRDYEGFSPDPYLTGELFGLTVTAIQSSGVQACPKHYIGNEQETQRSSTTDANGVTTEALSSNIDDRTMHELYLWPWANAIKAGAASVMCSYNRLNGSYACQNSKVLNGLLKEELGFQGYVMSDWGATHSGHPAVLAGQDMDMPGNITTIVPGYGPVPFTSWFLDSIEESVQNGTIPTSRLDDMCRRIMTPWYLLKQKDYPPVNVNPTLLNSGYIAEPGYVKNTTVVDVRRKEHSRLIRQLAAAGIVLLKNVNNTLPLAAPKNIGVLGNGAGDVVTGIRNDDLTIIPTGGQDVTQGFEYGVLATGPPQEFSSLVTPLVAIQARAAKQGNSPIVQYILNNTQLISSGLNVFSPTPPDVCLVFLKTWAQEGQDRPDLLVDWNGNDVVSAVAADCPNTVVVTESGGINVLPFADNENVTAILAAHWGGEEQGNSIADVLWGDVNPSGHLPYTIPYNESDYSFVNVTRSDSLANATDPEAWQSEFKERLLIDYRHFDYYNIPVQYEFGFGLSYTTFSLGGIAVTKVASGSISAEAPLRDVVPGGNPSLWEPLYRVTVTVQNTGKTGGDAVPQLYLSLPQEGPGGSGQGITPVKVLRGFEKVRLEPGKKAKVVFDLARRDISYWDTQSQQWVIRSGSIKAHAGFSSRDIKASTSWTPIKQ
ncbi:glycoside hydrolase superfamily [Aspergillus heterothallicus]